MISEKNKLKKSLFFPVLLLFTIWLVKFAEIVFNSNFTPLGLYPLQLKGLTGIITSPLIHAAGYEHLLANSLPLLFLSTCLFYFYRQIAFKTFILIYLLSGIWTWFAGREAFHIGASGLIYGLAAFLFTSGLIRKNPPLMAITLTITFLYGSLLWGIFPDFLLRDNISWESHLMGFTAGICLALYFRHEGPIPKKYEWEEEEENGEHYHDNDKNSL